jgi:hypothetical protein
MSEMRRMARMLVERRSEAFESRYARDESARRLESAIAGFTPKGMAFKTAWRDGPGATWLDVSFAPSRTTRIFLNTASLVITLMLGATLWSLLVPGEAAAGSFLVILATVLAILGFPFVVLAYASRREAEEATLRRKIRRAIVEEEQAR